MVYTDTLIYMYTHIYIHSLLYKHATPKDVFPLSTREIPFRRAHAPYIQIYTHRQTPDARILRPKQEKTKVSRVLVRETMTIATASGRVGL
jgi:hypothetical protein